MIPLNVCVYIIAIKCGVRLNESHVSKKESLLMSAGELVQASRHMDGLYQACFISFEYHLHLMAGNLVVAGMQKRFKQKNLLKTKKGCLLDKTRTPINL